MPTTAAKAAPTDLLRTLPGDDVRQIMWHFADRYDLQMLVQSTRAVARGPVARLVADGGRNDHDWTGRKNELLSHYDASGITAAFMEPEEGGFTQTSAGARRAVHGGLGDENAQGAHCVGCG